MKNTKNTLLKCILGACFLFAGVQSTFAACAGTIYFKAPDSWGQAVFSGQNITTPLTVKEKDASGFFVVDLQDIPFENHITSFSIANKVGAGNIIVTDTVWNVNNPYDANAINNVATLPCPGVGQKEYIMQDPMDETKTFIGPEPSGAKYFHVLVPDYVEWQADQIMINIDGVRDTVMAPDQTLCGWVTLAFNEAPSSVYIYRKNNPTERLGKGGLTALDAGEAAEPIELAAYFESFGTNDLYFIPDEDDWVDEDSGCWSTTDPGVPPPEDKSRCSFNLAALIYDTDQDLNEVFTSDGNTAGYGACVGVHQGIVMPDLDPVTKKPVFNSASPNATKCFGNAANFNTLFNYVAGKNEVQCYDMLFRHYGKDTRWGFDSDSAVIIKPRAAGNLADTLIGGFYPVENTSNASVVTINGVPLGPTPLARTKRKAEAPVPVIAAEAKNFDRYCNTYGWSGGIDCGATNEFNEGSSPAVWDWGVRQDWAKGENGKQVQRNQQFCFESHATFTYNEDQEFTFRGDDDIWVFINNKIAVDNGGAHLATPGHVVLKNLNKTYGAGFLVAGKEYPLDIFFCDRRTTMSNVIIKTNMYIVQKTAVTATKTRDPKDKSIDLYEMCYTESGDGSCSAALSGQDSALTCCGSDFVTNPQCAGFAMDYYLIPGSDLKYDGEKKKLLPPGQVSFGGIDLTNPATPVVNKKKIILPEPGRWTLFTVINGSPKKIASFRMAGQVEVVSGDAVAYYYDEDDKVISSLTDNYSFTKSAMAGPATPTMADLVPVYVTGVAGDENGKVVMQPGDAQDVSYKLSFDPGMRAFKMINGAMTEIVSQTTQLKVTGVDTIFVYVPQVMMGAPTQNYSIKVDGGSATATIQFYLPQLAFVDTLYKDANDQWVIDPTSLKILAGDTMVAGKYEERLTGYAYDFYLVALKPVEGGGYEPCLTCSLDFTLNGSSLGVAAMDPTKLRVENGGATFQVRSLKQYLFADNNPAVIHVEGEIPLIAASYTPVFFADPPCPIPAFTDVFDVVGSTPSVTLNIPDPYFSNTREYQDGIADMVDIYYNRMIPKDSLPLAVCIEWETSSAEKYYPAKEGWSTKDGENDFVLCNAVVVPSLTDNATNCDQNMKNIDGDIVIDSTTGQPVVYCDQRIRFTGLTLSSGVKTMGPGKVTSFSLFKDRKGNIVKQGFESETMIDRIAPMPVSVSVITRKDSKGKETDQDVMTVTMSEPVKIVEGIDRFKVFDFYITNGNLSAEQRYASATENTSLIVTSQIEPTIDSNIITVNYINPTDEVTGLKRYTTPYKDDYFRLSGSIEPLNVFWSDKTDITLAGADSIRAIVKATNATDTFLDETYYWNSPSGYAETKRLPSPWVEITGSAQSGITPNKFAYTSYASDTAKTPIVIHSYNKYRTFQQIVDKEGGIPGHFVMADMLSYFNLLNAEERKKLSADLDKVYFYYKVEYFTNLGNYVAGTSGKIYCKDETNEKKYGRSFFGKSGENKTCIDNGSNRNYYIGWNMLSDDGRQVGTGVYITKIEAYVKLGGKKDGKKEMTSTLGVKKGEKIYNPGDRVIFQEEF